jgi:flavorubredoxin
MRKVLALLLLFPPQGPYPVTTGKAYRFEKIADGVYYATATGSMVTGSNNVLIAGDRDVLVVDTGTSPAAARAFIEDAKLLTNKPIRYVVNSHFHYDHTDGNRYMSVKRISSLMNTSNKRCRRWMYSNGNHTKHPS